MTTASKMLSPFAALYGTVTKTRLALYRRGYLKQAKLKAPVISVGNLTTGGTGKTPLVEYICRLLASAGRKPCILTRGYGRSEPTKRVVVSDGKTVLTSEEDAGDEPFLLAQNLEGLTAIISDSDRFQAGTWALDSLRPDVFVLDDGFQHLQLARDLDILVVDATNPWGNGRLLPRGILREPIEGLRRADCIVVTRIDEHETVNKLLNQIMLLDAGIPVFRSRMGVKSVRTLGSARPADTIKDRAAAFSAIGNPHSFRRQLENEHFEVGEFITFQDHHRYTQADLDDIVRRAGRAGAQCLVTTAKDAVKLSHLALSLPCYVLDIEIKIDEAERFSELVKSVLEASNSLAQYPH